jgi:hypothetical protein
LIQYLCEKDEEDASAFLQDSSTGRALTFKAIDDACTNRLGVLACASCLMTPWCLLKRRLAHANQKHALGTG